MGTDDDIIRNGTWRYWLGYRVVFFGSKYDGSGEIEGGLRIKGKYLLIAAFVLGAVVGWWV